MSTLENAGRNDGQITETDMRDPSKTIYLENQFGELHRQDTDPEIAHTGRSPPADSHEEDVGKDARENPVTFRSDDIYPENRFGELGRADTFVPDEHTGLSDKLKEKAGHIIDKLTHERGHNHKQYVEGSKATPSAGKGV